MADTSQPSFSIALMAVLAGGAISSWLSAAFVGLAPATSVELWAILTSIVGAVFVKIVRPMLTIWMIPETTIIAPKIPRAM